MSHDYEVHRAVDAVRNSTPGYLFTALETQGLLEAMLHRVRERLGARPLNTIPTSELSRIGYEAVNETLGITSEHPGFPEPKKHRATPTPTDVMRSVREATAAWESGEVTAELALRRITEITHQDRQ